MGTFSLAGDPRSQIEAIYIGYLGRAADPEGLTYWLDNLNSGALTATQVATWFSVQAETKALYPFLANPQTATTTEINAFITQIYQNLFDRAPDAAGLAYWQDYLSSNRGSPQIAGNFILAVINGAQNTPAGLDQTTLANKVTASSSNQFLANIGRQF